MIIAVTALTPGAIPAYAQDPTPEQEAALFQLYTRCMPVHPTVAVERTSPYIENLSDSQLEEVVLTGLRDAGLLSEAEGTPFLYVAVGIVHWAYVVRMELLKPVRDPETDIVGAAPTWRNYRFGIHGGEPESVISSLGTALERFLDDYLLVNEGACGESVRPKARVPGPRQERVDTLAGPISPWTRTPRHSNDDASGLGRSVHPAKQ